MSKKTVKPAKEVVVVARVSWKHKDQICYIVRSSQPLKEGTFELKGFRKGDVTINGQVYGSIVRNGERYALYNVVFRDGVCSGCCCEASGHGVLCYHKKGCIELEGKRQTNNVPASTTPEAQIVEIIQTVTAATSSIVDLDAIVAQLEEEYAPVPALAEKLPSASQTVTKNLTSGRAMSDLGTVGSLNSNRQLPTSHTFLNRPVTSVERSLPSFLTKR